MWLGDLPPGSDFASLPQPYLQQILVTRIDHRIVLQEEGPLQAVLVQKAQLIGCATVEFFLHSVTDPRFGLPDEIDDVDESGCIL